MHDVSTDVVERVNYLPENSGEPGYEVILYTECMA